MAVLSTAERIGKKKGVKEGLQQGLQQGLHKAIADILEIKFGEAGIELAKKIVSISNLEILEELRQSLKKAASITKAEKLISDALE